MYCCYLLNNQEVSDTTAEQYFSKNSVFQGQGIYCLSEEMKNQSTQSTKLSLYGKEHYSLARNTEQYILFNSFPKNIPLELLQIIAEKSNNFGKNLQVFIPYSNDEQLLLYYLQQKTFNIYTLDDDHEYLNKLKNQKIFQQLKYVRQQEFIDDFDLKIFNCCSQTQRMFEFLEKSKINSISTNQVFILDYCHNPNEIISQIMKGQEPDKEELMTVFIEATKKYYLFFTGKMSSTQGFSRLESIEQILLENAEPQLNCPKLIKQLLKYLMHKKFTYQQILQIIGSIKQEHADELKKQQSDSILHMFLQKLINYQNVDQAKIQEIFQFPSGFLTKTSLTMSQQQVMEKQINSYDKQKLISNSTVEIQM
ncbi:unnamed protein product [Paramecium octaurelia]|uniref:Uncharacterized protein n=1 Tax=Paramecium octaurelia TaxID=43137 RepID=A0A8S1TQB3_PAROT|nr:unnamed protein product [Paramecium octaurelia]